VAGNQATACGSNGAACVPCKAPAMCTEPAGVCQ
jgi:hypothetical protein